MPLSGSYYYPVVNKPSVSLAGATVDIKDGLPVPAILTGSARIFVDQSDGDLKVIFSDGTIKTIVTDT